MEATTFVAILNISSALIVTPFIWKRIMNSKFPYRLLFLNLIIVISLFRSIFLVFFSEDFASFMESLETGEVSKVCKIKAALVIASHMERLIGIPIFCLISIMLIFYRKEVNKSNKISIFLIFLSHFIVALAIIYYFYKRKISIWGGEVLMCYINYDDAGNLANKYKYSSLICIFLAFSLGIILKYKKRSIQEIKPIIKASICYALVPAFSFFAYELYGFRFIGKYIYHVVEFQRITPFLLSLIYFVFERNDPKQKSFWNSKRVLEIGVSRNLLKEWLESRGERRCVHLLEIYEKNRNSEEDWEIMEVASRLKEITTFGKMDETLGGILNRERISCRIEMDLFGTIQAFMDSPEFKKFSKEYDDLNQFEAMLEEI